MHEKDLQIGVLLDFYGDVLAERRRLVLDLYYNDDYSLAEIAEEIGITRQGVLDTIKKGKDELLFLEEKLQLEKKFREAAKASERLVSLVTQNSALDPEIKEEILSLAEVFKS
jgi:predicted DNA-binding protein YlxM (UPF0122 family)